jgi:sugar/nucleoside kinase (ribokinase family)/adenylate kinase family enzyme
MNSQHFRPNAILLLGPTGSGKTPLGERIATQSPVAARFAHFDFGEHLRQIVARQTPDAVTTAADIAFLRSVLETGVLLEDEHSAIAERILRAFLAAHCPTPRNGVVLNGLPRHEGQARRIDAIVDIQTVVSLECEPEIVVERIRRNTGGDRAGRNDDDLAAVRSKLALFAMRTAPLVAHYRGNGARIVAIRVTADTTPDAMWRAVQTAENRATENSRPAIQAQFCEQDDDAASPRFDILGFGAIAVDDLLYVEAYPPAESKVRVQKRLRQCGGQTGTALVAAARMHARCAYVGVLGNDELSQFVAESFGREGVAFDLAARNPDARPAHSTIIVDQTHKTRTIFASLDGEIGADANLPSESRIRAARVILVDHHGLPGTLRAVQIARTHGVSVVADFERCPGPPFDEILNAVDHLILSARFATQRTGLDDPKDAAQALWNANRQAVVVTCGSAGAWFLDKTPGAMAPLHMPAFRVEPIDTTGCGDVFHGVYAACLAERKPLAERVRWASAAAAIKATQPGGQAGIPTREQIEAFLASFQPTLASTPSR